MNMPDIRCDGKAKLRSGTRFRTFPMAGSFGPSLSFANLPYAS